MCILVCYSDKVHSNNLNLPLWQIQKVKASQNIIIKLKCHGASCHQRGAQMQGTSLLSWNRFRLLVVRLPLDGVLPVRSWSNMFSRHIKSSLQQLGACSGCRQLPLHLLRPGSTESWERTDWYDCYAPTVKQKQDLVTIRSLSAPEKQVYSP